MRALSLLPVACLVAACGDSSVGPARPAPDTPPPVRPQLAGNELVVSQAQVKEIPARLDKLRVEVAAMEKEQSVPPEVAASIAKSVEAARAAALDAEQLPRRQHDPHYQEVSGAMGNVRKALQAANASSPHFTAADEQARVVYDLAEAWARQVNHRIVFVARGDLWEVYPWDPAPPTMERLTATPNVEWTAAWSPDGRRLAFTRDNRSIVVMNADGTGETEILTTPGHTSEEPRVGFEHPMSWSPDGTRIAFNRYEGSSDEARSRVCIATVGASAPMPVPHAADAPCVTPPDLWTRGADWSPDGTTLAVNPLLGGVLLWSVSTRGGIGAISLPTAPWMGSHVKWSHSGRRMAYSATDGVYVLDLATGASHRIGPDRRLYPPVYRAIWSWLSWSPDDRHLAVLVTENRSGTFGGMPALIPMGYISILSVDGGPERILTSPDEYMMGHLAWRPYVR
jgi:hypothetical protein